MTPVCLAAAILLTPCALAVLVLIFTAPKGREGEDGFEREKERYR